MVKVRWENVHCSIDGFDEALDNLKKDTDEFINCTRDEGSRAECSLESTKAGDDQYVCELSFRDGSVYSHPGLLDYESVEKLYNSFCDGDDFRYVREDWRKLQNSKMQNLLIILLIAVAAVGAFYFVHTHKLMN